MSRRLRLAAVVVVGLGGLGACSGRAAAPPPPPAAPADAGPEAPPLIAGPAPFRAFQRPAAALAFVLREERPRVVGLGEYHQLTGAAAATSAIRRFTDEMVATLAGRASDLIVETWMTDGNCGKVEARVTSQVKKTTERPATTENEVVALLTRAKGLGLQPHILKVSCAEYQKLLAGKDVDYEKLLTLITTMLRDKGTEVLAARDRLAAAKDGGAPETRAVVLYGGALHNDVTPGEGLESFSYAAALTAAAGGRYVEVDLYVPEYVRGDKELKKERWYHLLGRAGPDRTLLIERGPRSWVIILPTSPAAATAPASAPAPAAAP